MKRYNTTRKKIDKAGIRAYSTTYYPDISLADDDLFINTVRGERLDNLAFKYYSDASLWWVIAKANNINGKPVLPAGQVIRIPSNITEILENFNSLNDLG